MPNQPGAVAMDGAGDLLIADTGDQRVRLVVGSTGTFYGQAVTTGDIHTIPGNGQQSCLTSAQSVDQVRRA